MTAEHSTEERGADELDCLTCGACCFSERLDYIEVFAVDRARMDAQARALTTERGGRRFMRASPSRGGRHCAALAPESAGRFPCAIYACRPDACRWLQVGSGECLDQRRSKLERARRCVEMLPTPSP